MKWKVATSFFANGKEYEFPKKKAPRKI